jgi:hypothetical protein
VEAVSDSELPPQIGLGLAPAVGVEGTALTVATVLWGCELQPFKVAITEYEPLAPLVALDMDGFCWVEVKPLGPDH